ncbi:unnamed protein product [Malus baccata var. baccata]
MSVFSGFGGGICADFFGDEYGVTLPNCKPTSKANDTTPSSSESSTMNKATLNKNKNMESPETHRPKPRMWSYALSLQPTFDGLFFFVKPSNKPT